MYPPKFDYYRANSVEEALSLLQQHSGAKLLAGGHSLLPTMKLRLAEPEALIDIGRIADLKGISRANGAIRIGALTTHAMAAASADLPAVASEAAGMIGDPQVRNRGTIGGNIAHADPASDWPTVLVALEAMVEVQGADGTRSVRAEDCFLGLFMTDVQPGEIVTAITLGRQGAGSGSGYAKLFNPASRYAMVSAAAVVNIENGHCMAAQVAVGGLTVNPVRAPSVEQALVGQAPDEATIKQAARHVLDDLGDDLIGDIHASAAYRRNVTPTFVARALTKAVERAG